jgi:membrane associated rhomboid family serine protease/Zn-finger nucleic acid-binding protein
MRSCPRCQVPLQKTLTTYGCVYGCATCRGRMAALPVLRHAGANVPFLRQLRADSLRRPKGTLHCPHCSGAMVPVTVDAAGKGMPLDVCPRCASVWFDRQEYEALPKRSPPLPPGELSPRAREQFALARARALGQGATHDVTDLLGEGSPAETWQWIPGILGLPIEYDAPRSMNTPWLTWAFCGGFVIAFLVSWARLDAVVAELGFIPAQWSRHEGLTFLTSFFLHGGVFHLLVNLYFLAIFGDNVEDDLGRVRFAALLLGGAVGGDLIHMLWGAQPDVPLVGASGGIAAIMGYYALAFPWARLGVLWVWFNCWWSWLRIPVLVFLAFFAVVQILGAIAQAEGFGEVSSLAHLGGLAVGVLVAIGVRVARWRTLRGSLSPKAT